MGVHKLGTYRRKVQVYQVPGPHFTYAAPYVIYYFINYCCNYCDCNNVTNRFHERPRTELLPRLTDDKTISSDLVFTATALIAPTIFHANLLNYLLAKNRRAQNSQIVVKTTT